MRASRCGLWRDGHLAVGRGLIETRRFTIAPPGGLPLRPTLFSLVDVPDLQALPELWPELKSVWMGAGPVPEILHRALNVFARAVPLGLLRSLGAFAPRMHAVVNVLRWGEHRGGMFVEVEGADVDGRPIARSWHMIAEGDDGPLIPSTAAEAIIRRRLDGRRRAPGARAATRDLELTDYEALFARRKIVCGIRETPGATTPLYRRLLGDAYAQLPAPIQALHDLDDPRSVEGLATIERGHNLVARAIAAAVGFPPAGEDVPMKVLFTLRDGREIWRRTFADHSFTSTQEERCGSFDRLMCEWFGPFAFGIAFKREADRLRLVIRRWSVFGIPLPHALAPFGSAYECAEDGRFHFHVEIRLPLIGLIVGYRGWLVTPAA